MNQSEKLLSNKYVPTNLYFNFSYFIIFLIISAIAIIIIKSIEKNWKNNEIKDKNEKNYSVKEFALAVIILSTLFVFANYSIVLFNDNFNFLKNSIGFNYFTFFKILIILIFVGTIILSKFFNKDFYYVDFVVAFFAVFYCFLYLILTKVYLFSKSYNPSNLYGYIFMLLVITSVMFLTLYYHFEKKDKDSKKKIYKQYSLLIYFFIALLFRTDGYDVFNSIKNKNYDRTSNINSFQHFLVFQQSEFSKKIMVTYKFLTQIFSGFVWGRITYLISNLFPFNTEEEEKKEEKFENTIQTNENVNNQEVISYEETKTYTYV